MKKVFLSLFCLVLLCGCTVNKPAQIETTTAPDTAAAGELTVRCVWITYYELQAFTGKYDTGGDFYSAVSKAFVKNIMELPFIKPNTNKCIRSFCNHQLFIFSILMRK